MRIAFTYFDWSVWAAGSLVYCSFFSALKHRKLNERHEIVLIVPPGLRNSLPASFCGLVDEVIETPFVLPGKGEDGLSSLLISHAVDILFSTISHGKDLAVPLIGWVPDFQHLHMPDMFDRQELIDRDEGYYQLARDCTLMVATSQPVKHDFAVFAPIYSDKGRQVHCDTFFSEQELSLDPLAVAAKYNLPEKFFFLPNQFWKHKNHELVTEALEIALKRNPSITVVCSGNLADYRHPARFDKFISEISCKNLRENFIVLGWLSSRDEVWALMRRAQAILQPSLFEGFGMALSEAKALNRPVILSDIPVFNELAPLDAVFFDPRNAEELAEKLLACYESLPAGTGNPETLPTAEESDQRALQVANSFLSIAREARSIAGEKAQPYLSRNHGTEQLHAPEPYECEKEADQDFASRKRILILSPSFPPRRAGGADYALRMAQELHAAGNEVIVLTSDIPGIVLDPNVRVLPLFRKWTWRELPLIFQTIRELQPDIVDLHFSAWAFNEHPMITFLPEMIRRWMPKTEIVSHIESHVGMRRGRIGRVSSLIQSMFRMWSGKSYSSYEFGTVLKSSHKVMVLSTGDLRSIQKQCAETSSKSVLTPPPPIMPIISAKKTRLCRTEIRERFKMSANQSIVVFYGYIYPGKGIESLLETFGRLQKKHDLKLIFVGDFPDDAALLAAGKPNYRGDLCEKVDDLGLKDHVIWSGYMPHNSDEASKYLRAADICCVPFDKGLQLHRSSFSYPAAHGLPIISTQGPDTEQVFVDGQNVLLCPPRNASAITAAIESLLADVELRGKLSRGALKLHNEWYTWDTTISRMLTNRRLPKMPTKKGKGIRAREREKVHAN